MKHKLWRDQTNYMKQSNILKKFWGHLKQKTPLELDATSTLHWLKKVNHPKVENKGMQNKKANVHVIIVGKLDTQPIFVEAKVARKSLNLSQVVIVLIARK